VTFKRIVPKESKIVDGLVPEHIALSAFRNFTYSVIHENILIYISRQSRIPETTGRAVVFVIAREFLFIFRTQSASRASINKRYTTQE